MKLQSIAEKLGAKLKGDGEVDIIGVNTIEAASSDQITFITNPKYRQYLESTNAGAVIVSDDIENDNVNLLYHANPHYAFCQALTLFFPPPASDKTAGIASSAIVDASADVANDVHLGEHVVIGSNTKISKSAKIMAGAVIGNNCHIGEHTLIYPNVILYDNVEIGNNCVLHAGVVAGSDGYGYCQHDGIHHKMYQVGGVRIADNVEIGANTTIDRGALGDTIIGEGTKIDNLVQIAHNVQIGKHCLIIAQVGISGSTKVGNYVIIAGQAGLVGHIEIGDKTIIGAQAGIPKSLPAGKIFAGSPAQEHKDWKLTVAHLHSLPKRHKELKAIKKELADLQERLKKLEQ